MDEVFKNVKKWIQSSVSVNFYDELVAVGTISHYQREKNVFERQKKTKQNTKSFPFLYLEENFRNAPRIKWQLFSLL